MMAGNPDDSSDTEAMNVRSLRSRTLRHPPTQGTRDPTFFGGGSARSGEDRSEPEREEGLFAPDGDEQRNSDYLTTMVPLDTSDTDGRQGRRRRVPSRERKNVTNKQLEEGVQECQQSMGHIQSDIKHVKNQLVNEMSQMRQMIRNALPKNSECNGTSVNPGTSDASADAENASAHNSTDEVSPADARLNNLTTRSFDQLASSSCDPETKRLLTELLVEARVARGHGTAVQSTRTGESDVGFKCKPSSFDGSTSWYHYVTHIEAVAEANRWPKSKWAQFMRPYLQGTAQDWYKDLDQTKLDDWTYVVGQMGVKLGETPQVCQSKATHLQFNHQSDLVKGCADLCTWVTGGFPNMNSKDRDELIKSHFERALPTDLKREVAPFLISNPNMSVSELARYADTIRQLYYTKATRVNQVSGKTVPPSVTCYQCGEKGHYKNNCPKAKHVNHQGNQGGKSKSKPQASQQQKNNSGQQRSQNNQRNNNNRGRNGRSNGNRNQRSNGSYRSNNQHGGHQNAAPAPAPVYQYPPMVPIQYVAPHTGQQVASQTTQQAAPQTMPAPPPAPAAQQPIPNQGE